MKHFAVITIFMVTVVSSELFASASGPSSLPRRAKLSKENMPTSPQSPFNVTSRQLVQDVCEECKDCCKACCELCLHQVCDKCLQVCEEWCPYNLAAAFLWYELAHIAWQREGSGPCFTSPMQ